MDTALELRINYDKNNNIEDKEEYLEKSDLVKQLTEEFIPQPLFATWRIIALSEIPGTVTLSYTQKVVDYIEKYMTAPSGYSLNGKDEDLLPCYNSMILEAYIKLGLSNKESAQKALEWIKNYQLFGRGEESKWQEKGIKKYGGCFHSTPCYMGVAKAVKALVHYQKVMGIEDEKMDILVDKGVEYLLSHKLYKRLSNGEPITSHIVDLSFPASYQLNILELLEIAYLTGTISDERCLEAIKYIESKKEKDDTWRINYVYKSTGYESFDQRGKTGEWTTYLLNRYIKEK